MEYVGMFMQTLLLLLCVCVCECFKKMQIKKMFAQSLLLLALRKYCYYKSVVHTRALLV